MRTFKRRSSSAQPRIVPKWPVGSGVIDRRPRRRTISPVVPEIEMTSPSRTVDAADGELLRPRGRSSRASAPQIAGLPMPRATTAACDTRPPRDVRMPSAAIMPCRSSGDVSGRTRMTRSPASWRASASSAVKYTLPTAAPGDAFRPLASTVELGLRVELRVQQLVELRGLHAQHRFALVDEALARPSRRPCAARPRRCACRRASAA